MDPCTYSWMTISRILIKTEIFETHININLICIHGYTKYVAQNELITLVSIISWKSFLSKFPQAKKNPVPGQLFVIHVNK